MTDHRCEQLRSWINELDGQIGMLNEQRDMLASALGVLDGSAFAEPTVEPDPPRNVGGRPRKPVPDGEALEARRAADRERKKAERQRLGAKARRPARSKYDYAEVARIANAAGRAGLSYIDAVASKYGVGNAMASYLVKEARDHGHDIAKTKPKGRPAAASNVTPIAAAPLAAVADIETVNHPATGPRAFTPADTLRMLERG